MASRLEQIYGNSGLNKKIGVHKYTAGPTSPVEGISGPAKLPFVFHRTSTAAADAERNARAKTAALSAQDKVVLYQSGLEPCCSSPITPPTPGTPPAGVPSLRAGIAPQATPQLTATEI